MLLWLLLGSCFSRALRGSWLVVECDIIEQIVGLNGGVDDLTALGAMKKGGKIVSVGYTVYCCYVVVWKPLFCEIPNGGGWGDAGQKYMV